VPTLQPAEIKGTGSNSRNPGMEIVRFARQNCGRIWRALTATGERFAGTLPW
jgi:hypothetical protein